MREKQEFDEFKVERLIVLFKVLIAVILIIGVFVAIETTSGRWIDRSGKVMVAVSFLVTFWQFRYENQVAARSKSILLMPEKLIEAKGVPQEEAIRVASQIVTDLQTRIEKVRLRLLLHALVVAGIGELIAAFGEDIFLSVQPLFG
jgi:hypothetical protein